MLLAVCGVIALAQYSGGVLAEAWPFLVLPLLVAALLWRTVTVDETGIAEHLPFRRPRYVTWDALQPPASLMDIGFVTDGTTRIELGDLLHGHRLRERIRRHFAPRVRPGTTALSDAELEALLGVVPGGSLACRPQQRIGCLPDLVCGMLLMNRLWLAAVVSWLLLRGWGWLDCHRREVRASAAGLRVRAGFRVRRVAWSQVVGIERTQPPAQRMYLSTRDYEQDQWIRLAVVDAAPVDFYLADTHGDTLGLAIERIVAEQALGRATTQTEGVPDTALSRAGGVPAEAERGLSVSGEG